MNASKVERCAANFHILRCKMISASIILCSRGETHSLLLCTFHDINHADYFLNAQSLVKLLSFWLNFSVTESTSAVLIWRWLKVIAERALLCSWLGLKRENHLEVVEPSISQVLKYYQCIHDIVQIGLLGDKFWRCRETAIDGWSAMKPKKPKPNAKSESFFNVLKVCKENPESIVWVEYLCSSWWEIHTVLSAPI